MKTTRKQKIAARRQKDAYRPLETKPWQKAFAIICSGMVAICPTAGFASALPTGADTQHGQVGINYDGTNLTIDQGTNQAIINWDTYNIGAINSVIYNQPNASAAVLNRVIGGSSSVIEGLLSANGNVLLLNDTGILIGAGAVIDTNSFLASTLNMSDSDFLSGEYNFTGDSSALIEVHGDIRADDFVTLIAKNINNQGNIVAKSGTVALAATETSFEIDRAGGAPIKINVSGINGDAINSGYIDVSANNPSQSGGTVIVHADRIGNEGTITADAESGGGYIEFDSSGNTVFMPTSVVTATGGGEIRVNAPELDATTGEKVLTGNTITHAGSSFDTSGGADDGFIEISGVALKVHDETSILAGHILFDPLNIEFANTADANVTGFSPPGDITEALADDAGLNSVFVVDGTGVLALAGAGGLDNQTITFQATNNVTVTDIFILGTATASSSVNLVIEADNDIILNNTIAADNSGTITLTADADADNAGDVLLNSGAISAVNGKITVTGEDITTAVGTSIANNLGLGQVEIIASDALTLNGTVSGGGNVTITATNGNFATANTISAAVGNVFINAAGSVVVQDAITAGGIVQVTADTDASGGMDHLTIDAGASLVTNLAGALLQTGGGTTQIILNSDPQNTGGGLTFGDASSIEANNANIRAQGPIDFGSNTINVNVATLGINGDLSGGNVTAGNIDLGEATLAGAGTDVNLDAGIGVITTGNITVDNLNIVDANTLTLDDGTIDLDVGISLAGLSTGDSINAAGTTTGTTIETNGASIDFTNYNMNGAGDLTIDTETGAGTITLDAVGQTTPLGSLTVTADVVDFTDLVTTAGDLNITHQSNTTDLDVDFAIVSNAGDITMTSNNELNVNTGGATITATAGDVFLTANNDNENAVTQHLLIAQNVSGNNITFASGGDTAQVQIDLSVTNTIGNITINPGAFANLDGDLTATNGDITINGDLALRTDASTYTINSGDELSITGTINNLNAAEASALNLDGTTSVALGGAVGDTNPIGAFDVDTATLNLNATAATDITAASVDFSGVDTINYADNFVIDTSAANGDVNLGVTTDIRDNAANGNLTVNAGNGTITITNIGQDDEIGVLDLNADDLVLSGGNIDVSDFAADGITNGTTVAAAASVDITSSGNITINAAPINGAGNLKLDGQTGTVTVAAVGDVTPLLDFAVFGGTFDHGAISATGDVFVVVAGNYTTDATITTTGANGDGVAFGGDFTSSLGAVPAIGVGAFGALTVNHALTNNAGTGVIELLSDSFNAGSVMTLNAQTIAAGGVFIQPIGNAGPVILTADLNNTAGGITFNNSDDVQLNFATLTANGDIDFTGMDNGGDAPTVTLGANVTITSTNNDILFANATDSVAIEDDTNDRTLALVAGAGNVVLGDVGQTDETGALTITSATTLELRGDIATNGTVDGSGAGAVTVFADADNTIQIQTQGDDVNFAGTAINGNVAGSDSFTIDTNNNTTQGDATAGTITLGNMGDSTALGNINIDGGDVVLGGSISAGGFVGIAENDTNADGLSTGGAISSTAAVIQIIGDGAVTVDHSVTANGAGATISVTAQDTLTVNAAIDSDVSVTLQADSDDTAGENLILNNATILADDVFLRAGSAAAAGSNIVTGANINNTEGNITADRGVTLVLNNNLSATGDITVNTLTEVAANSVVTATGGTATFTDDIHDNASASSLDIVADTVNLNTVGVTSATLSELDVDATALNLNGATITTTGDVLFDGVGTTTLNSNVTITSNGGAVNLSTFVDDDTAGGDDRILAIAAGAGAITVADIDINTLTLTSGASVTTASNAGLGAGTDSDITLDTQLDFSGITDGDTINLGAPTIITAAGVDTTGENINGAQALTINAAGQTVTLQSVGNTTPLSSLTVTSNELVLEGANVNVDGSGNVDFTNATTVNIAADVTIDSDAAGGATDAGDVLIDTAAIIGNNDLTINTVADGGGADGAINLGAVGQGGAGNVLGALVANAGTGAVSLNGNISTDTLNGGSAEVTVTGGTITLLGDTTIDTDAAADNGGGTVSFSSTVNGTTEGEETLTIDTNDAAVAVGEIGTGTALGGFTVVTSAATTLNGNISTSDEGTDAANGAINLNAATGGIILGADVVLSSVGTGLANGGDVDLNGSNINGTFNAAESLTIIAGTGAVDLPTIGDATNLEAVTVTTSGVTTLGGNITTNNTTGTGEVNLTNATGGIVLTGDTTIKTDGTGDDGDGGAATFGSSITDNAEGASDFAVDTGDEDISLTGGVGGVADGTALGSLTLTTSGSANLGGTFRTSNEGAKTGNIDLTGVGGGVVLTSDTTIDTTGSVDENTDGQLLLGAATINGTTAGVEFLDVETGDAAIALNAIGNTVRLESVTVNTTGTVTLSGDISTVGGGNIDFTEAQDVDLAANVTLDTDDTDDTGIAGDILFNAAGDIDGTGAFSFTADASTTDTGDIDGGTVTLPGVTNLTSLTALSEAANNGNGGAINVSGAISVINNVTIDNDNGVAAGGANAITVANNIDNTGAGTITIAADGALTQNAGTTINSTGNTANDLVLLSRNGNVTLAEATASDNASIHSFTGTINDNDSVATALTAPTIALVAEEGIGTTGANGLEVNAITTLAATTEEGNLTITDTTGGLTIGTVSNLANGVANVIGAQILDDNATADGADILIRAQSPLTVINNVINSDGGDITLAAEGNANTDDLTLNANVIATGGSGNINLFAGGDVDINGTSAVSAVGAGAVNISAGEDFNGGANQNGASSVSITMDSATSIVSGSGNISIEAKDSIQLSSVSTTGNVTVSADDADFEAADNVGAITDNNGATTNITGATATLSAAEGIGSGDAIETEITTINAVNSTSGTIEITETDSLALDTVDNSTGRNVILIVGGNITDAGDGNVDIIADTATLNAGGAILAGGIGIGQADDIETTVGTLVATTAADGDINIDETDAITLQTVTTNNGNIIVVADGTVTIDTVTASGADNDVTITTATGGDIQFGDGATFAGTITSADDITLNAAGAIIDNDNVDDTDLIGDAADLDADMGIGSGAALDTQLTSVDARNVTANNIQITEEAAGGALDIINATQVAGAAGNIDIQTLNGVLTVVSGGATNIVDTSATGAGTINLQAAGGNLVINDGVASSTGSITLTSTANDVTFAADGDVSSASGDVVVSAVAGAVTMVDGTVVNAGSGHIDITAANDVTLGLVQTTNADAVGDAVDIDSTAGSIVDINGTSDNIIALNGTADLDAGLNIGQLDEAVFLTQEPGDVGTADFIEIQVANINATVDAEAIGVSGEIALQDTRADGAADLAITGISTPNSANEAFVWVDSQNNGIDASAIDLTSNTVIEGTDSLALTSSDVGDNNDDSLTINHTGTVSLNNFRIDANDLIDTTGGGNINDIAATNFLAKSDASEQFDNMNSTNIDIEIRDASNTLTYNQTGANGLNLQDLNNDGNGLVDGGALDDALKTNNGNITVTSTTADINTNTLTDAGTGDVVFTTGGSIVDAADADALDINADQVYLEGVGIGAVGNVIETTITALEATATTGGVFVTELAAGGDLILNEWSAGNDAGNTDAISSTTGNVVITANNGSINQGTTGADGNITTGSGTVTLFADGGAITMFDGTITTTTNAQVDYNADTDVSLSQINTTAGVVNVNADFDSTEDGAIIDNLTGEGNGNENIIAGVVSLTAADGIGSGTGALAEAAAIDTAITSITLDNSDDGNIQISESANGGALTVTASTQAGAAGDNTVVETADGTLTIAGNVAVSDAAATAAAITLQANDATAGDDDDVIVNAGVGVTSQGGTITIDANSRDVTLADTSTVNADDGLIVVTADDDVQLSNLVTTNATAAAVTVTADDDSSNAGAIVDNGDSAEDITAASGGIILTAATGIGDDTVNGGFADNDLEIDGLTLSATNSTDGDVRIEEANDLGIVVVNNLTRDVYFNFGEAGADSITDSTADATSDINASRLYLNATTIGALGNALDTDIDIVEIDSTTGGVFLTEVEVAGDNVDAIDGDGDLTLDDWTTADGDAIVSTTGGVQILTTFGTVFQTADIETSSGTVLVDANGTNADIRMSDGTQTKTDNAGAGGQIDYEADEDVWVSILDAGSATVNVTANIDTTNNVGAIFDILTGEASNVITTGTANLSAATGIGADDTALSLGGTAIYGNDNDIDTTVAVMTLNNTNGNNINIDESASTSVTTAHQNDGGGIYVVAAENLTTTGLTDIVLNGSGAAATNRIFLQAENSDNTGTNTLTLDGAINNQGGGGVLLVGGLGTYDGAEQGSDTSIDVNASITADAFIDMRASNNITIDSSTITVEDGGSSIYIRANDGNFGTVGMGTVEINNANGGVSFVAEDDANGLLWISGYDIFIENNATFTIDGTDANGDLLPQDTNNNALEFAMALVAENDIGTVARPLLGTATLANGSFVAVADEDTDLIGNAGFSHFDDNGITTDIRADGRLAFNRSASGFTGTAVGLETGGDSFGGIEIDPNANFTSGQDIVNIAPEAIQLLANVTYSAQGDIFVVSTENSVTVESGAKLLSGLDDDGSTSGDISLIADTNVIIEENVQIISDDDLVIRSGDSQFNTAANQDDNGSISIADQVEIETKNGDIILQAFGAAGTITIGTTGTDTTPGNVSTITSDTDIIIDADGAINIDGTINSVTGFTAIQSGSGTENGSVTFGEDATLNISGDISIGGTSVGNDGAAADDLTTAVTLAGGSASNANTLAGNTIELVNTAATDDAKYTQYGALNTSGSVNIDLDTDNIQGDLDFGTQAANGGTGSITAGNDVTITVDDGADNDILGDLDINADQIIITAANAAADISVSDIIADEFLFISAGNSITTGNLQAAENATAGGSNGFAIKLDATAGDITVNGTTTANANAGLNVDLDPVNITVNGDVDISGNYTATASNDISINADVTTSGGNISITADDDAAAGGTLTMGAGTTIAATNGEVDLSGDSLVLYTVTAGSTAAGDALDITSGTTGASTLTLNGALQGQEVDIDANTTDITINAATDNILGSLDISGTGNIALNADLTTAGALTVAQAITVGNDATISGDLAAAGGAITLNGAIDSASDADHNLVIAGGSGAVTAAAIGTTTALDSVTISTSGTTTLNGGITAENNVDLSAASDVDLGADVTITSDSGNILLNGGDVAGAQALTLTATGGDIVLDTIGNDLTALTVSADGAAVLNGDITTAGAINFSGSNGVTLNENITLTSGGNDIDLGSTNDTAVTGANRTLTVVAGAGIVSLDDVNVGTLTLTSGGSNALSGDIVVDNAVDFSAAGDTTLGDAVTVTTSDDAVTFAAIDGAQDLDIDSGTGTTTLGVVGGATPLSTLDVTAGDLTLNGAITTAANGDINLTTVTGGTTGDIAVANAITTSGTGVISITSANDLGLESDITTDAASTVNLTATGAITDTTDATTDISTGTLNILSATSVGAAAADAELDIDVANLNIQSGVTGDAFINEADGLILNAGFTGDLDLDAAGATTTQTLNAQDVTITVVGDTLTINDATVDSLTVDDGTVITVAGAVNSAGITSITGADTEFALTGSIDSDGAVTLDNTLNDLDGPITSASTVTITGATEAGSIVNGTAGVTVNSPVTLTADGVFNSEGSVLIDSTVDGAFNLTLSGSTVTTNGVIGGTTGVNNFNIDALEIDINADVTDADAIVLDATNSIDLGGDLTATAGDITVIGGTTISGAARTVSSDTGNITFNNDVSGAQDLTLNAAAGTVTLDTVGAGVNVSSLDVNSTAAVLNGDIAADGSVILGGAATTTVNASEITIDTVGGADGSVVTLNALTGAGSLTIDGGDADVSFNGAVTNLNGLNVSSSDTIAVSSTVDVPGAVNLVSDEGTTVTANIGTTEAPDSLTVTGPLSLGANLTAENDVTLNGATTQTAASTITSTDGNIDVNSTVAGAQDLTLVASSGNVALEGLTVGALDVDAATAELNGDITATSVDTTGTGTTTLVADTVNIDTTGNVNLGTTADNNLTVTSTAGDVTFTDATLTSLVVDDAENVFLNGTTETIESVSVTGVTTEIEVNGMITSGTTQTLTSAAVVDVNAIMIAAGDIAITGADVDTDANITSTGGNVTVTGAGASTIDVNDGNIEGASVAFNGAGATVTIADGADLNNSLGSYTFDADNVDINADSGVTAIGNIDLTGASSITLENGSNLTSTTGDVTVNSVLTLDGAAGASTITSDTGSVTFAANITDGGLADRDLAVVAEDTVTVTSTTITGAGSDLALTGEDINMNNAAASTVAGNFTATAEETFVNAGAGLTVSGITTIDSGNTVTIDGTLTADGAAIGGANDEDIIITATNDITVNAAIDSTNNEVDISSSEGSVIINSTVDGGTDVDLGANSDVTIGGAVTADAGDVTVDTTVGNVAVNAAVDATAGNVAITSASAVTSTASIDAGMNVTVGAQTGVDLDGTVTADANDITVTTATGNIDIDGVTDATAGMVTLTATAGDVTSTASIDAGTSIVVTANGSADFNDTVTADANDITVTTATGNIDIDGATDATAGTVTLTATAGDVTSTASIDAGTDVTVTANGDADFNDTVTADAGNVTVTTETGNVDVDGAVDATAGNVAITSAGVVNSTASIDAGMNVTVGAQTGVDLDGTVTADANDITVTTATGNIDIDGATDATVGTVTLTATAGDVTSTASIDAGTDVTVTANGSADFNDTVTADAGNVTVTTETGNVDVDGAVDATAGNVAITSAGAVNSTASIDAGMNVTVGAETGVVFGSTVTADANDITVTTAMGDIDVNGAVDATAGTVNLTATMGSVNSTMSIDAGTDVNVTADANIDFNDTVTADAGNITATAATGTVDVDAAVDATAGNVTIAATAGDVNTTASVDAGTDVSVTAGEDVTFASTVTADAGNITVDSGNETNVGANITAAAGMITMNAGTSTAGGGINNTGAHIIMAPTVSLAADGAIGSTAANIFVDAANVTSATTGVGGETNLNLTNTVGTSVDVVASTQATEADINLTSASMDVLNLNDVSTQESAISVTNNADINAIMVHAVDDTPDGSLNVNNDITLTATGTGDVNAFDVMADSDVAINTENGSLNDGNADAATDITAGQNINLSSGGMAGSLDNPVEVEAGESLTLTYPGTMPQTPFWVVVNGTVAGSQNPESIQFTDPGNPPGLVLYNGVALGGPYITYIDVIYAEGFNRESIILSGEYAPVFSLAPHFFTHSVLLNNHHYDDVPTFEHINNGSVIIEGVPEGMNVPTSVNIMEEQDVPFKIELREIRESLEHLRYSDSVSAN